MAEMFLSSACDDHKSNVQWACISLPWFFF